MILLRFVAVVVVMAVWMLVGFLLWVPLLVRTIGHVTLSLLSSVLTKTSILPARHALAEAVGFYALGFRLGAELLRDQEPIAPFPHKATGGFLRIVGEVLYAVTFWAATLFFLGHLSSGSRLLHLWGG